MNYKALILASFIGINSYSCEFFASQPGPAPLACGGYSLDIHAGIAPTFWHGRHCFQIADVTLTHPFSLGELPSFQSLYKMPWDFGFRLGYALYEDIELTFEFDYHQSAPKCGSDRCNAPGSGICCGLFSLCFSTPFPAVGVTHFLVGSLSKYKAYFGHFGARWYSNRYIFDAVAWYIGAKLGFVHHRTIDATITQVSVLPSGQTIIPGTPFRNMPIFKNNTTISGGFLVGIDWCVYENVSVVGQLEIILDGALHANKAILGSPGANEHIENTNNCQPQGSCTQLPTIPSANLTIIGANFKREIVVPLTFGLKYYF